MLFTALCIILLYRIDRKAEQRRTRQESVEFEK